MRAEFEAMRRASQYYIAPKIRAKSERLIKLSEQTGKSIHELAGGTPATQKDFDDMDFGAQFNFPEVSG